MNWYRVMMPHDNYAATDVGRLVLMAGGAREASLELQGYLRFVSVDHDDIDLPRKPRKAVKRGKQVEAGPPEVEPVLEVAGD